MGIPLRVLFLEDSPDDAELIALRLKEEGFDLDWQRVETKRALLAALKSPYDLILADYALRGFTGMDALQLLKEHGIDIPVILVSGTIGEDVAVQAMKQGAHDYLLKDKLARLGSSVHNVLEQKKLSAEKRLAEEKLRLSDQILQRVKSLVLVADPEGKIIYVSPSAEEITGYHPDELLGEGWWKLSRADPAEAEREKESLRRAARGEVPLSEAPYERPIQTRSGETRWIVWQDSLGPNQTIIGVGHDVTERKRAAEEVRASERRYRSLFEYMLDGYAYCKMLFEHGHPKDFVYLDVNPAFETLTGLKDVVGKKVSQIIPGIQESNPELFAVYGRVALTGKPERFETYLPALGIWFSISVYSPEAEHFVAIFDNITERKQAEQELRESEARKTAILESALDGVITIDHLGRIREFNPAAESIFRYRRSEVLGKDMAELIIPPSLREQYRHGFAKYLATGEGPIFGQLIELTGMRADGQEFPVELTIVRIISEGPPVFTAFLRDITGRKQAVQAIREAEERYRTLIEQLPMIVYINSNKDIAETTYVSPQIQTILGYTPEEWLAAPKSWLKALHPEDRQAALEKVESINRSGEPFDMEYRMMARDGRVVWFRDQAVLIRDPNGQPLYWQGLMIDITEGKQRERELEAIAALSAGLREIQSTDEILLHLLSEALTSVNAKHGGVWLHDPDRNEISLAYEIGQPVKLPNVTKRGEGIIGLAVETGDVVISDDLQKDARVAEQIRELVPAGLSAVCVPLPSADRVVGAMLITRESPREFTPSDIRILTALAQVGGSAIHRTALHEQTVHQVGRLAALRTIDMAITSSLDLNLTLNVVLDQVLKQLGVDAADVLLLKPNLQILEFASGKGFKTQSIETSSVRLGDGLPGQAALERKIIFVEELAQSAFKRQKLLEDEKFISYYAAPLIAKGKVKGVLEIFHRSALIYDLELVQFLEALADQAAIAIDNSALFYDLQRSNIDLALAYDATIEGWSRALDLRDKETEGHTQRVTDVTIKLGRAMGLSDQELVHIRRGALLHDIGKMGVPDNILLKAGPLTDEEWEIMRKHPSLAYEMLMPIAHLRPALDIPYCHHEKWDGTGYPRALKGEQIPLSARIFAVVDVWDALRSDRPYRKGWEDEKVLNYLHEQSGKHFDPQVLSAFLEQVLNPE